jgi:hypothetical protein
MDSRSIFATAKSSRNTHKDTVSFVAHVSAKQSAWEQSGKFEGDIMLTEEQMKNGLVNTVYRWPNKLVPYYIDPIFSEYCSIKLKFLCGEWREISIHYVYRFRSSTHWWFSGRVMAIITYISPQNSHKFTCQGSHVNIPMILRSL